MHIFIYKNQFLKWKSIFLCVILEAVFSCIDVDSEISLWKYGVVYPFWDIELGHMRVMWFFGGKIFSSLVINWVGFELRSLLRWLNLKKT